MSAGVISSIFTFLNPSILCHPPFLLSTRYPYKFPELSCASRLYVFLANPIGPYETEGGNAILTPFLSTKLSSSVKLIIFNFKFFCSLAFAFNLSTSSTGILFSHSKVFEFQVYSLSIASPCWPSGGVISSSTRNLSPFSMSDPSLLGSPSFST